MIEALKAFLAFANQPANPLFTLVVMAVCLWFGFRFLDSRDWFTRMIGVVLIVGILGTIAGAFPLEVGP